MLFQLTDYNNWREILKNKGHKYKGQLCPIPTLCAATISQCHVLFFKEPLLLPVILLLSKIIKSSGPRYFN